MILVPSCRKFDLIWSFFPLYFLLLVQNAFVQMHPVAKASAIHFTIHNFGFKTGGQLDAPEGNIVFNPDDLVRSSFQVTIKSTSINTGNETRDEHLRETDYFDVKDYPLIRFVSSSIQAKGGKNSFVVSGSLIIKKTSRVVSIPFTVETNGNGWLFTGQFTMNRRDYDVGGSSTISNELTVDIKVLAR
jgi:polyisoprenoid-binding protein YceI